MTARTLVFLLSFLTPALTALQAPAQDPPQKRTRIVKPQKTVYDFDAVDITGRLQRPSGATIVEPPEFRFRRLLDLDESFLPNIVRGVDDF